MCLTARWDCQLHCTPACPPQSWQFHLLIRSRHKLQGMPLPGRPLSRKSPNLETIKLRLPEI